MPNESGHGGLSQEHLIHWVRSTAESDFVDAKGPMLWDGKEASASLAKDIASFSNSKDGGVVVIGKAELAGGVFSYEGVSPEQAKSFDTTKVMQWVNARFAPPITAVCYQVGYEGSQFIVIVVQEFSETPSICTRDYPAANYTNKLLLREGAIYVRNQNAESKPLSSIDELRTLIGLATRKKGDELLSHFHAMLKGRSLTNLETESSPFDDELRIVRSELDFTEQKAGWWMSCRPVAYRGQLWSSNRGLEQLIAEYAVRIIDTFPGHRKGTFPMAWGIANSFYGETWGLTLSGQFFCSTAFRENSEQADRSGYRPATELLSPIQEGEWLECTWAARTVVEFVAFVSRFVGVFDPEEEIDIEIEASGIRGRVLVARSPDLMIGFGPPSPCRTPSFSYRKRLQATAFRTDWKGISVEALSRLFGVFPDHMIDERQIAAWVERYGER